MVRDRKTSLILLLLVLSVMGIIMFQPVDAQTEPVLTIAASVAPLGGIVEDIGQGYLRVLILLPEGVEPHAAQLPQSAINAANDADLLVFTGHFEWETALASQVTTPYITLEDYEAFGARLSELPGHTHNEAALSQGHDHEEGNPHAYWLLPDNAIAIANATRNSLTTLHTDLEDFWQSSFDSFVTDIAAFENLVQEVDGDYAFSDMQAVVVFPAEAYVAEAFGIEVRAVLTEGENVFISGDELLQVQQALSNGTIDLILGSDVARLQAGGEFATQLAQDTDTKLIWWRAIFFSGLSDYVSIMTYNLGALTSGLEQDVGVQSESLIVTGLAFVSGVLAVIVVIEAVLLYNRARSE